jgi:hypothetical protein
MSGIGLVWMLNKQHHLCHRTGVEYGFQAVGLIRVYETVWPPHPDALSKNRQPLLKPRQFIFRHGFLPAHAAQTRTNPLQCAPALSASCLSAHGSVAERFKAPVLKTGDGASHP